MHDLDFSSSSGSREDNINLYFVGEAKRGFENALDKNFWHGVSSLVTHTSNALLDFDNIIHRIPFEGQYDAGIQEIPVDHIKGSVGRVHDFSARFLPRSNKVRHRWVSIARANLAGEYIPPIEVYQIGSVYFVKDGNHRVSVARSLNQQTIMAHVIVIQVPAELEDKENLDSAIEDYQREEFFRRTRLDQTHPELEIKPTIPGFYQKLLDHISAHSWLMGVELDQPVAWDAAVSDWLETVYLPVVRAIREHHLLAAFPGRSDADLYVWITEYAWYKKKDTGATGTYDQEAQTFAERSAGELQRIFLRLLNRS